MLLGRLEEILADAKAIPLSNQVRLDPERLLGLLDELRERLPSEVAEARWLVREREDVLAEASRESERLLLEARARAGTVRSEATEARLAQEQAEEILRRARRAAFEISDEVERWADELLSLLENNLERYTLAVRRGRERALERSSKESVLDSSVERAGVFDAQAA